MGQKLLGPQNDLTTIMVFKTLKVEAFQQCNTVSILCIINNHCCSWVVCTYRVCFLRWVAGRASSWWCQRRVEKCSRWWPKRQQHWPSSLCVLLSISQCSLQLKQHLSFHSSFLNQLFIPVQNEMTRLYDTTPKADITPNILKCMTWSFIGRNARTPEN